MKTYKQISLEEREKIYRLLKDGISLTKIALLLSRNKSSISREVARNNSAILGYLPDRANNIAKKRKDRMISKIANHQELQQYIVDRLSKDKWSPELIAGRIKLEKQLVMVSHETIYKFIYSHHGQKLKLYQYLMYARPQRQLKCSRKHRYKVGEHCTIANRPSAVNERAVFGHFEGDLTFFKGTNSGNLLVLTERCSRKTFIIKNSSKRSLNVMLNLRKITTSLPKNLVKSITFDNGGEFRHFALLGLQGINTYFCRPEAPYQKGQVERTNAVLHKFIPKRSDFNTISGEMVLEAQSKLNNLPRKCLNFLTPNEAWNNLTKSNVALQT